MNKHRYITEVSEAIGEINRLATLCNQLNICTVQIKIHHEIGYADVAIMPPGKPIEHHKIVYNVESVAFFGEKDTMNQFEKVAQRLDGLTNQAAQTA